MLIEDDPEREYALAAGFLLEWLLVRLIRANALRFYGPRGVESVIEAAEKQPTTPYFSPYAKAQQIKALRAMLSRIQDQF